eukprot:COSAG02_NODE_1524_length_12129_cov_3.373067_7_plen_75_part_00
MYLLFLSHTNQILHVSVALFSDSRSCRVLGEGAVFNESCGPTVGMHLNCNRMVNVHFRATTATMPRVQVGMRFA